MNNLLRLQEFFDLHIKFASCIEILFIFFSSNSLHTFRIHGFYMR